MSGLSHWASAALVMAAVLGPAAASEDTAPLRTTPDGRPLTLVFSDDFKTFHQYGEPGGVWRTTFGDGTEKGLDRRTLPANGELELYVDSRLLDGGGNLGLNPFRVRDGQLQILAEPTPPSLLVRVDNHPYVSGMISSQPSFSQTYGYFEMRAKIPGGAGLWPAFWMLPQDLSWPPEIDVMESVGDASHIYSTVHSSTDPATGFEAHITPNAFHTFAVSWDPKTIAFYVDGRKIGAQPTPPNLNKPMHMIANLAVGGTWPGSPDATTGFPAAMTIAFIRAYRFTNE